MSQGHRDEHALQPDTPRREIRVFPQSDVPNYGQTIFATA